MRCPKCQFDNPEDSNFCLECGQKLEQKCPQCEKALPLRAKFCNSCGHELTTKPGPSAREPSFDEKLSRIQKYLPQGLTEKILSQRDRIEGERKQVTVMFCDLEGYTALSEKLGPEETYAVMDQVYEILIHKVHDYEGTINEMTGDGIMALFGAPIALEDAPQRAIRSSLSIHREITRLNDALKQQKITLPPLKLRIGIHAGPVVVGTLGNDLRVDFKAVGDTVNLASRMEGLAEPGTTLITEDIFKLTEGFFRFEALGKKQIKGKEEPVKVYRVIASSTRRTRFEVSTERGLTPFIGRDRELELLLDGFERSKTGKGQAFSIVAEAGIGKTRLLYEFRKAIANEPVTFLEGRCLSYSRGIAYHPIIDILKSNFDILETDGETDIIEKIKNGLNILGADEISTLPYILELFSIEKSGIDKIPISPQGKKDRINEALKRIVAKGSEIQPLIMAIEDLHWIDKSSEDVFISIVESISGSKVFLIFTYRPEYLQAWAARSYHNQINLNRLSNRECLAMASYHLNMAELDRDLENLILEKAEGIPFFIEEFIKSLKNLDLIARKGNKYYLKENASAISVPTTIQDVILARVDKLSDAAKEVLQAGSVIEREFSYELIKKVVAIEDQELMSYLSTLKDAELLNERGIYPDLTYIFTHALTREVVYNSILNKRRKNWHSVVGEAIEELYKEKISENYGLLVEHFYLSERYEKAGQYSKLASRKALKSAAVVDAIEYSNKLIASLENLPRTDETQRKIIDARSKLGLNFIELNFFHDANMAIEPIFELTEKIDYKKRIPQIYTVMGAVQFCVEETFQTAFKYLETALQISEELDDIASIVYANYWLGYAFAVNCEFSKALFHMEQSLDFHVKANSLSWVAVLKSLISYLVYYYGGNIRKACQFSREAVHLSEETGDIHSKLFAYSCYGVSLFAKGVFEEAKSALLQGLEFSQKANQAWWEVGCNLHLGDVYFYLGEHQNSQYFYTNAVDLLKKRQMYFSCMNVSQISLEKARVAMNDRNIDIQSLPAYAAQNRWKIFQGLTKRSIAEILFYLDERHLSKAEEWIKQAINEDEENQMSHQLGHDYAIYAKIFDRKGQREKSKETLSKAMEIFDECGANGWVEKYEKELAAL